MVDANRAAPPGGDKGGQAPRVALDRPVSVLAPPGLVSILVPCCGQLEYTRLCVPSVLRHSRSPFELIFVDVGSLDGTAEYLAGVAAAAQVRVEVVRTPTDLGIAQAVQEALDRARGECLVLLNNDKVVTDGWLDQLVALSRMSPTVGLVGPMSNYAAPPQLVETVPYRIGPRKGGPGQSRSRAGDALVDVSAVEAFAKEFREKNKGKWVAAERLGGFCLLVKREALLKMGPLEAAPGLGLFDTDLLSLKAWQAGYTLACCRDLFVHHFGTRAFAHGAPEGSSESAAR